MPDSGQTKCEVVPANPMTDIEPLPSLDFWISGRVRFRSGINPITRRREREGRPHFGERFNGQITQSDRIAFSVPGELDHRFGYYCHCGIIVIDQAQLTQCIFERHREQSDGLGGEDFIVMLIGC
jgi:hypothetical protein